MVKLEGEEFSVLENLLLRLMVEADGGGTIGISTLSIKSSRLLVSFVSELI